MFKSEINILKAKLAASERIHLMDQKRVKTMQERLERMALEFSQAQCQYISELNEKFETVQTLEKELRKAKKPVAQKIKTWVSENVLHMAPGEEPGATAGLSKEDMDTHMHPSQGASVNEHDDTSGSQGRAEARIVSLELPHVLNIEFRQSKEVDDLTVEVV